VGVYSNDWDTAISLVPFFWNFKIAGWVWAAGNCLKSFNSNTDSNPVLKDNSESFRESKIDKVILVDGTNGLSKRRTPNAQRRTSNLELRELSKIVKVIKSVRLGE
jgi:hypothetical protein